MIEIKKKKRSLEKINLETGWAQMNADKTRNVGAVRSCLSVASLATPMVLNLLPIYP